MFLLTTVVQFQRLLLLISVSSQIDLPAIAYVKDTAEYMDTAHNQQYN